MNPMSFLIQMLPLIVFIIVDSLFNNVIISIISAIVFAIGQLVFFYLKTGQFDWFVLLDVGLIVALGTISIVVKNDIFFKVKPAVIEGATIIFLIVLIASPDRFLLNYFGRMMPPGMSINPSAISAMKNMLLWMSIYMFFHIGAVLYTAFYSSRKIWALVSGVGFYLLFIPIMGGLLFKKLRQRSKIPMNNASNKYVKNLAVSCSSKRGLKRPV